MANEIVDRLRGSPTTTDVRLAGSLRRFRPLVADVDVVAASDSPGQVTDELTNLTLVNQVFSRKRRANGIHAKWREAL